MQRRARHLAVVERLLAAALELRALLVALTAAPRGGGAFSPPLPPGYWFGSRPGSRENIGLAGAYALLVQNPRSFAKRWRWSETLLRDVITLQRLIETHDRLALYDAGERVARQLPAVLHVLGRDESLDFPDFTIRPLLDGNELTALLSLPPGPELGRVKRALLEAQVMGEVTTREEAERFAKARA